MTSSLRARYCPARLDECFAKALEIDPEDKNGVTSVIITEEKEFLPSVRIPDDADQRSGLMLRLRQQPFRVPEGGAECLHALCW